MHRRLNTNEKTCRTGPPPLEKSQVAIGFLKNACTDPTPQEVIGLSLYNKLVT